MFACKNKIYFRLVALIGSLDFTFSFTGKLLSYLSVTMSTSTQDLVYQSRRVDNATKIKRQAAANALQQYSLLALQAVKDCEVTNL